MSCNKEENSVYKIVNNYTGTCEGIPDRSSQTKCEFYSISDARSSNIHGVYKDKKTYRIQKWKVTYELIEDDCDPWDGKEQYDNFPLSYGISARDLVLKNRG